jgi:GntR family transcriptional regulator/MocR family aminotransferase
MIASGAYLRHVRHVRTVYRGRRDLLLAALARDVPGLSVTGVSAGLHVYLGALGEAPAARAQAALDALAVPAQVVRAGPAHLPGDGLVIGFASLRDAAAAAAVARAVADALA